METTTITVHRYRTPKGKPTCAIDVGEGKHCAFLGAARFGLEAVCLLGETQSLDTNSELYLQPHDQCRVWYDHDDIVTLMGRRVAIVDLGD